MRRESPERGLPQGPNCMTGVESRSRITDLERRVDENKERGDRVLTVLHGDGDEPGIKGRVERIETKLDEAHRHRNTTVLILGVLLTAANFVASFLARHFH